MSEGELVEWNDDRGFGFIRVDGGDRIFVHINSIRRIVNRPRVGDRLRFRIGTGRDGRPAAIDAAIAGANPLNRDAARRGAATAKAAVGDRASLRLWAAAALIALAAAAVWTRGAPLWVLAVYLGMGALSIATYWIDKSAAEGGRWRTPEKTLHGIDLAGGIVGGLVAQALLRHKTSKPEFGFVSFGIALVHALALAALLAGAYDLG